MIYQYSPLFTSIHHYNIMLHHKVDRALPFFPFFRIAIVAPIWALSPAQRVNVIPSADFLAKKGAYQLQTIVTII